MDGTARRFPYLWVTWITGLVSGEKQCWWASWFRAHYQNYAKFIDSNQDQLAVWKAEHAQLVRANAAALQAQDYHVTIEDQNKINARGAAATVGAKPDIIAQATQLFVLPARDFQTLIVDCKTGKRRDSDFWQVVTYVALATLKTSRWHGHRVAGQIAYGEGEPRYISPETVAVSKPLVWNAIKLLGAIEPLARVPSVPECARCDIACCPDRITSEAIADIQTDEF